MKVVLKLLSSLMVWGVVVYTILYVDPTTIRDLGLPGLYLPFLLMVFFAAWYTALLLSRSLLLSIVIAGLVALALILSFIHLMTPFTWIIILLLIIFSIYLYIRRDSLNEREDGVL